MIGFINLDVKNAGERSAGNPPAAFDVEGAGNVVMETGWWTTAKAVEKPSEPNARASSRPYRREGRREPSLPL